MQRIDLKSYKVKEVSKSLAVSLNKFNLSSNKNTAVFLFNGFLPSDILLDISSTSKKIILIFSNIKNKNFLEVSDLSKIKEKEIIYIFKNCAELFYLKDFKGKNLSFNNKVFLDNSTINFSNVFFDVTNLNFLQENNLYKDSQINQNDVLLLSSNQKNKINVINNHLYKETVSNTIIKNVLKENSFSRYDGMINIIGKGDFSKAYLETNTMLLSKDATSISIPMLEIVPKNIKATHAATVEHVTEEQLFYLSSRALSREEAYNLMVSSFLKANLESLPDTFKEHINKKIKDKL